MSLTEYQETRIWIKEFGMSSIVPSLPSLVLQTIKAGDKAGDEVIHSPRHISHWRSGEFCHSLLQLETRLSALSSTAVPWPGLVPFTSTLLNPMHKRCLLFQRSSFQSTDSTYLPCIHWSQNLKLLYLTSLLILFLFTLPSFTPCIRTWLSVQHILPLFRYEKKQKTSIVFWPWFQDTLFLLLKHHFPLLYLELIWLDYTQVTCVHVPIGNISYKCFAWLHLTADTNPEYLIEVFCLIAAYTCTNSTCITNERALKCKTLQGNYIMQT